MLRRWQVGITATIILAAAARSWHPGTSQRAARENGQVAVSAGWPGDPARVVPVFFPTDNPYTPEKAELGWLLYFDKRLSGDGTLSCGSLP